MNRPAALFALLLFVLPHGQAQRRPPARPPSPPPPRVVPTERPVPFAVGERLTYDVSWSSFLTAATATIAIRDKRAAGASPAYYITAEGVPTTFVNMLYPVYYKADALVGIYDLLPQWASVYSREQGKQQTKTTSFDQVRHTAVFELKSGGTRRFTIPPNTQDALSALFWVRTLELRPGLRATMPVSFNGDLMTVQVTVNGRETLGKGSAARQAWRLTPIVLGENAASSPRKMALWLSDDNRRVPLRMEVEIAVGRFEMTLTGAVGK